MFQFQKYIINLKLHIFKQLQDFLSKFNLFSVQSQTAPSQSIQQEAYLQVWLQSINKHMLQQFCLQLIKFQMIEYFFPKQKMIGLIDLLIKRVQANIQTKQHIFLSILRLFQVCIQVLFIVLLFEANLMYAYELKMYCLLLTI